MTQVQESKFGALIVKELLSYQETKDKTIFGPLVAKVFIQEIMPRLAKEETNVEEIEYYHHGITDLITSCVIGLYYNTLEYRHVKKIIDDCWYKYVGCDLWQYLMATKLLDEAGGDDIVDAIKLALEANPKIVQQYKAGKDKVIGSLVGPLLKQVKANPAQIVELIKKQIELM